MVLYHAFEENPERFVRGLPTPLALPEQVWINKPKKVGSGNPDEPIRALNLLVGGVGPENGFHNCLITNDFESGRDLPMGQNHMSDDLVQ